MTLGTTDAFAIDGIMLLPQPTEHEWDTDVIGADGDGKPFRRKYRTVTLRLERPVTDQVNWAQFDDGSSHTVTVPAPDTVNDWTDYATVYVVVQHGRVGASRAFDGLIMTITMVDA